MSSRGRIRSRVDTNLLFDSVLEVEGIVHGFETRHSSLQSKLPEPFARLRQVHSSTILRLDADETQRFLAVNKNERPAADALITNVYGITLAVATADCLPVLIAAPGRAVAAVHAGWRGIVLGVVAGTLGAMAREYAADPSTCRVAIGPGVGPCCYHVQTDVVRAFQAAAIDGPAFGGRSVDAAAGSCDLAAAVRYQAEQCGVPVASISVSDRCTSCEPQLFHSYRRDGDAAGRQLAGIAFAS